MDAQVRVRRGEVWYADFGLGKGSEQSGARPVLIIQNDVGNEFSPTVIVAALTDRNKRFMPTHLPITKKHGLDKDSVILMEQIRTIDKSRLTSRCAAVLPDHIMQKVDQLIKVSLGLIPVPQPKNR